MGKTIINNLHPVISYKPKISNYFTTGNLLSIVKEILSKRNSFFILTKKYKTPFYVYDQAELDTGHDL